MSLDISIKQKFPYFKALPFELIVGDELRYGSYEMMSLKIGAVGEGEFLLLHPKHIGRGFSVIWNENEKRRIDIRLPSPSTRFEIADVYRCVERIASYWSCDIEVNGEKVSLEDFRAGYKGMVEFEERTLDYMCGKLIDGSNDSFTLFSARWPLTISKSEAEQFSGNPVKYAEWLHKMQDIDAEYAEPLLYETDEGIIGRYIFADGISMILPKKPWLPPAAEGNGKCEKWIVSVFDSLAGEQQFDIEYCEFFARIEKHCEPYDCDHIICKKLTLEEAKELE
ncbi:MAG: DUF4299 family protein [Clostridia bacterium]|nr:DUF4299 family protein [Clostridia bacterium]